jgi:hypothetical protein
MSNSSSTPNKQSALDPLPTWLLQSTTDELAPFITRLLSLSMSEGMVPVQFKTAVITPLVKKPTAVMFVAIDPSPIYQPFLNCSKEQFANSSSAAT